MKHNNRKNQDKKVIRILAIVLSLLIILPMIAMLSGCGNKNFFDGSDMIQVRIDDKVYLTHSSNVVLISE